MKYAKKKEFSYDIELSKRFSPMLVKALRSTENAVEQGYLMKFYDVCGNDDTCDGNQDVEDILDEDEYLEVNENLVAQEHRDVEKVEAEDLENWIKREDETMNQQRKKISLDSTSQSKVVNEIAQTRKIRKCFDDDAELQTSYPDRTLNL